LPLTPPTRFLPLDNGRALPLEGVNASPRFIPLDRGPVVPGVPPAAPLSSMTPAAETPLAEAMTPAARDFVARVWPDAVEASRATGIPAQFMVAQAALETGWGRAEPRLADGRPSHNLFGIKAGRSWNGAVAEAATTEYVDGVAQRQTERFRAYGSYTESFRDYAKLLTSSPRYAGVVGTQSPTAFAHGLQRAGYATDPQYADKLTRIIAGLTPASTLG
jgi:flagellar protein FlgJ